MWCNLQSRYDEEVLALSRLCSQAVDSISQDITASGMLGGMQLVTIPIDPKWQPFTVITRLREIIASQNSTHVFIGAWTVSYPIVVEQCMQFDLNRHDRHIDLIVLVAHGLLACAGLPRYRAGCCGYYGFILRVPCSGCYWQINRAVERISLPCAMPSGNCYLSTCCMKQRFRTADCIECPQSVTAAKMGRALKELLFQYNWKRVGLLYRPGPYSLAVTEGILNEVARLLVLCIGRCSS